MTHKAVPGQPLIVKAGEYNAAMEAGQWFSQQKQLGESQSGIVGGVNPCVVKVKNDSGGNLAAGTVVELSSSLLTTLDRQHLWLSGIARAGNDPGFGVLIEPIKSGEIGLCQVSGVCLASVDIQDADNTHARLVASSTTLKGCFGGPVEILQKPSGTGVKTCVVRLGVRQSIIRRAKAAEAINAGDSGDVDVYLNGSSRGTIEAFNNWDAGDVANDDEIRILYHHDLDKWEILKRGGGGTTPATPAWGAWTLGGSGYVFQDGSGTADTTPYQLTSSGLWLFGQARSAVRLTNELGTVFNVNATSLSYDLDFIEIQQYGYYEITLHTTWIMPPLSLTNARTLKRVAGHTHSYTDNGTPLTTGTTTPDAASIDCGGVVKIQSEMYYGATSQVMGISTLPVWYGSDEYQWMSHSDSFILPVTFTLRNLRFKVSRLDLTSYAAPEFSTATLVIKQLHPFSTSAL